MRSEMICMAYDLTVIFLRKDIGFPLAVCTQRISVDMVMKRKIHASCAATQELSNIL
jgi:hypothetical protein